MKSKKFLYLALISCSLFFASCSMNKNNIGSASLGFSKMQLAQQLEGQKVALLQSSGDSHIYPEIVVPGKQQAGLSGIGFKPLQIPVVLKHKNSSRTIASIKKQFRKPVLMAAASSVVNKIEKLQNAGTHTAAHKDLPFADANLLLMWIIFALLSILLYFIAGLFVAWSLPGILFTILGLIALLIFLYFLILWSIQLFQESKTKK